jgi:flavin prenyltransferase
MAMLTETGSIIYPTVPAFYAQPSIIEQMVDHTIRVLDLLDIDVGALSRWQGIETGRRG